MKFDKLGIYVCRDGRVAVRHKYRNFQEVNVYDPGFYGWAHHTADKEFEGEWKPVELPKFPELPPKPKILQCYVIKDGLGPFWREFLENGTPCRGVATPLSRYAVIPHPDNDPEAVRLIEEAQK